MAEFDIIREYFVPQRIQRDDVVIGIGDDAAIVDIPQGYQLVTAVDTMVAGTHFFADCPAEDIAYKSLAVNLSDLAAMGATPAYFTLALSMENENKAWLQAFSKGLFGLAQQYQLQLIGGDTTKGPLSITIQVMGYVKSGESMTRNAAKAGDAIFVTGDLGRAGLALQHFRSPQPLLSKADQPQVIPAMQRPQARINEALAAKPYVNAAIDISDGLVADLSHILQQSQLGARIYLEQLPIAKILYDYVSKSRALEIALHNGDEYELILTVPASKETAFYEIFKSLSTEVTKIGQIEPEKGLRCIAPDGHPYDLKQSGFEHFS